MPIEIFLSFAREDKNLLDELKKHLVLLQQRGLITLWDETRVVGGAHFEQEVARHLESAQIILLLISADFIASEDHYLEMRHALERARQGEARVIPVLLRPVHMEPREVLGELAVLPANGRAVTDPGWDSIDEALHSIALSISQLVEELQVTQQVLEFALEEGDIRTFEADVLGLKYAQEFWGTDEMVANLLQTRGVSKGAINPGTGDYRYVETYACIRARHALFVGVPDITNFTYRDIQEFAALTLRILSRMAPETRHLVMTIHGSGFGLDEIEAFIAQFTGFLQAIQNEEIPSSLAKITIIDNSPERVRRLRRAFEEHFSRYFTSRAGKNGSYLLGKRQLGRRSRANQPLRSTIEQEQKLSEAKSHVFVAMPFKPEMDDVFYYGIQQPVRAAGFICERVDQDAFLGDILEQVKKRIETAAVVIVELSGANPNVYLELGYAWGRGRPTILLVKDDQELRFDVRGQRCLKYKSIRDLEETLKKEIHNLKSKGFI